MYFRWKPYVPVAARRAKAERSAARLLKKGQTLSPVSASRGAIARSFWGKAWCENMERYSDYSNRLPRGRTYLRNGSVIDLKIAAGEVSAQVSGSSIYRISVKISALPGAHWQGIARDCARSIDTLVELLQGRLSSAVMERVTRPGAGLFPSPKEIRFSCSCPDSAAMCKHVAATLYGIGARLDASPELLFILRKVDASELIAKAGERSATPQKAPSSGRILDASKLTELFGIDVASGESEFPRTTAAALQPKKKNGKKHEKKKSPVTRRKKAATRLGARSARRNSRK
jgi:uncharacterized Zn finger protein